MSVFADAYSRYLTNNFNYKNKVIQFRKYFRSSVISLTDPNFISKALIADKDNFPKYPYFLNPFVRTDAVNLVKIYESTMDNTETLVETLVGSPEIGKKEFYDNIPSFLSGFLAEVYFQFAYISTPTNLYNYDLIIRSFVTEYQYRNFFSDLYNPLFYSSDQIEGDTIGLEDESFLYEYMLYSSTYNVITFIHNIYPNILRYLTYINNHGVPADKVNQSIMLIDFQTFVSNYSNTMSIDLSNIIAKSMYNFQNVSPIMGTDLIKIINDKITDSGNGFYKSFYDFYNPITSLNPVNFLANNFIQQLNAYVSIDLVSNIFNDYNIVNEGANIAAVQQENIDYETFMGKMNEFNLKNYLFLCFLYKFWPLKFLNILQLSLKEYTENVIKSPNDNLRTNENYGSLFTWFVNNYIDYTNLNIFLNTKLTPTSNLITYGSGTHAKFTFTPGTTSVICSNINSFNAVNIHDFIYADGDSREFASHVMSKDVGTLTLGIENEYLGVVSSAGVDAFKYNFSTNYLNNVTQSQEIAEFACIMYYIYVLEEYFKSTEYDTFIEELTEDIFVYLRDTGHVEYTFDWYEFHDVIDVYFKTYLRWKLIDQSKRCILSTNNNASYKFTHNSSIVYCANEESFNLMSDGDFLFSEQDSIILAGEVLSHSIIGSEYILNLTANYLGQTTETGLFEIAYSFKTTDAVLFNTLTQNFVNKLLPKILTNSTHDPAYDFNIVIPNKTDLFNYFSSFSNSQSFIRSMHQFNENLMVSTLTREVLYGVLSDFV